MARRIIGGAFINIALTIIPFPAFIAGTKIVEAWGCHISTSTMVGTGLTFATINIDAALSEV